MYGTGSDLRMNVWWYDMIACAMLLLLFAEDAQEYLATFLH